VEEEVSSLRYFSESEPGAPHTALRDGKKRGSRVKCAMRVAGWGRKEYVRLGGRFEKGYRVDYTSTYFLIYLKNKSKKLRDQAGPVTFLERTQLRRQNKVRFRAGSIGIRA